MPGGNPAAWPHVKEIFQSIAAKVSDGSPVWSIRLDDNRPDDMGEGPRATPTIEGEATQK